MVSTTNPERLSQLAIESRQARIEREHLRRQSHLVKEKHDEITTKLDKFKRGTFSVGAFSPSRTASVTNKLSRG